MSDILTARGSHGFPIRLVDKGDGTYSEVIEAHGAGNIGGKFREAFEVYQPNTGDRWVEAKDPTDLVFVDGNALAASYLVISKSPFDAGTETTVELHSSKYFTQPTEIAFGAHMSQRTLGQEFAIEAVDTNTPLPDVPELAILGISQTTSTVTIDFALPHGLVAGKSVGIRACSDPRLNYPSIVVASTPSPTQITANAGPGGTLPSLTIANPAGAKGFVYFRERFGRANDGVAMIFENATATNASGYVRSESGDALPSGTALGNHSVTVGSTASVQLANTAYTYAFAPTTEYRLLLQSDRVQIANSGVDATAQMTAPLTRTQVCPDPSKVYKLRLRATNNKALTVPNAQIVSVTKTGTTTATVVTDVPHNYVAGDPIVAYGPRDQVNFANLLTATAVASVVDANTFTIVWGSAVTATSYGGYVARVNGGNLMSALGGLPVVAQSAVLSTLVDGTRQLVLTGNTTWSGGLLIGDLVNGVGLRDATTGASLGVDGVWKVANSVTTALTLVPATAAFAATLPADFGSVNCGGAIIKRTDLRVSFVRVFDYERLRVEALGRAASDAAAAFPVTVQGGSLSISGTPSVSLTGTTITGGQSAHDAAVAGGPVRTGGRAITANYTGVAAGDAADYITTVVGAQITKPYAIPEQEWAYTGQLTATTDVVAQAAAGAGLKRHPTMIDLTNETATAISVNLKDGATVRQVYTLPPNGSKTVPIPTGIPMTANSALNLALSAAGSVRVNLLGYTAP